jgi:holliday junction DNA helicase RuvA
VYDFIEGEIVSRSPARLVIATAGVGYELSVPVGSQFPSSGHARAWTHLVVREDAHILCGFADQKSRELFRLLLSVSGVGPVMGLTILSGMSYEPLVSAIANKDAAALTRIKGVGKRTAEQILLDLSDKLVRSGAASGTDSQILTPAPRGAALLEETVAALISIGYSEKEARKSAEKAMARSPKPDLESVLRAALSS